MRLFAFIIALLLLAGSVDPTRGWLITLVVVTGIAALRPRPWNWFDVRPAVDLRLASFVLAILLLAGTIDPTRDWLIALSAVTGIAAFMPRLFGFGLFGSDNDCIAPWPGRSWRWTSRPDWQWGRPDRRAFRRARRAMRWEDDWS